MADALELRLSEEALALLRRMENADAELLQPSVEPMLRDAALFAQARAIEHAPKATGTGARSIGVEIRPLAAKIFTRLDYMALYEGDAEGWARRPGGKMPPIEPLRRWINFRRLAMSPYALARSIARRGIRARPFFAPARADTQREFPRFAARFNAEIERRWRR